MLLITATIGYQSDHQTIFEDYSALLRQYNGNGALKETDTVPFLQWGHLEEKKIRKDANYPIYTKLIV